MSDIFPMQGIVSVLNTPFTKSGRVDYKSLTLHIREAKEAGVVGFLVPAKAAEVDSLNEKEKLRMLETTLIEVGGSVPVIAGAGGDNTGKSKELIRAYLSMGCRNVLVQFPYTSEASFKEDFFRLAEEDVDMIMLQDWDANGYGLRDELICDLFEKVETFKCLKVETVPAGVKYSNILRATGGRLHVSGGWAVMQMPEGLRRGVHAFMLTTMYRVYVRIYNEYKSGRTKEAISLFNSLLPVLAFSNQHLEISIYFFKRMMYRQGIYKTDLTRPLSATFDEVHGEMADKLIDFVSKIEKELRKSDV